MGEQQFVELPLTAQLLNRIEQIQAEESSGPDNAERLTGRRQNRALQFGVVLSAAALRGEGVVVTPKAEQRVVDALDLTHRGWVDAVLETRQTLGPEAINGTGAEYMSIALTEEAQRTVQLRPPLGYQALREMVRLAARQEVALENQADIVEHNITAQAQQ